MSVSWQEEPNFFGLYTMAPHFGKLPLPFMIISVLVWAKVVLTRACPSGLVALLLLSAARGDHAIGRALAPGFHARSRLVSLGFMEGSWACKKPVHMYIYIYIYTQISIYIYIHIMYLRLAPYRHVCICIFVYS